MLVGGGLGGRSGLPVGLVVVLGIVLVAGGWLLWSDWAKRAEESPFGRGEMVATDSPGEIYEDENFRFQLGGFDEKWRLLLPDEIKQVFPSARAGAVRVGGMHGAVVVEPVGEVALEAYLQAVVESLPSVHTQVEVGEYRWTHHKGRKAREVGISTRVNGARFRTKVMAFLHQGHAYQLYSWYPVGSDGGVNSAGQEFFDAVTILDGEVTTPPVEPPAEFNRLGRRFSNGRLISPWYRVAAKAPEGWTIEDSAALFLSDPDAELGLYHPASGARILVTAERVVGVLPASYREEFFADLEKSHRSLGELTSRGSVQASVDGRPLKMNQVTVAGSLPTRLYYGLIFDGEIAYKVTGTHLEQGKGDQSDLIMEGLSGVEFLDEEEAAHSGAELARDAEEQWVVGRETVLRNGLFRDFQNGVVWKVPAGVWRIGTGALAARWGRGFRLVAHEITTGVRVSLSCPSSAGGDEDEFHRKLMGQYASELQMAEVTKLPDVRVGGALGKYGKLSNGLRGTTMEYRIMSTHRNGRAYTVVVWGFAGNLARAEARIVAVREGLSFPGARLRKREKGPTWHRDHVLGFELRVPGTAWRDTEIPFTSMVGTQVRFERGDARVILLAAHPLLTSHSNDSGSAVAFQEKLLKDFLKVNLDRVSRSAIMETGVTVAGQPGRLIRFSRAGQSLRAITFSLRGTVYVLQISEREASEADRLASKVIREFKFVP